MWLTPSRHILLVSSKPLFIEGLKNPPIPSKWLQYILHNQVWRLSEKEIPYWNLHLRGSNPRLCTR